MKGFNVIAAILILIGLTTKAHAACYPGNLHGHESIEACEAELFALYDKESEERVLSYANLSTVRYRNEQCKANDPKLVIESHKLSNEIMQYEFLRGASAEARKSPDNAVRQMMNLIEKDDFSGVKEIFADSGDLSSSRQYDLDAMQQAAIARVKEINSKREECIIPEPTQTHVSYRPRKASELIEEMEDKMEEMEDKIEELESRLQGIND